MSILGRQRRSTALRGGRYVLCAETRRDATGVLWRGTDRLLGREVAVKEVLLAGRDRTGRRDLDEQRLLRQVRAAMRLSHPQALTPLDLVQERGRTFIVAEHVPAVTLAELVQANRACTPTEAAAIGGQLLDVLQAAHRQGIVHGDLRPDNVLVLGDGRLRLAFLGLPAPSDSPFTPPREVRAAGGRQGDLWSLGATLYWSVEGSPPADGAARSAGGPLGPLLRAALGSAPQPLPTAGELRRQLDQLSPDDRPASLARLLDPPAGAAGARALPPPPSPVELGWLAPTRPTRRVASASARALLALVAEGFASRLAFGLVGFALPLYARSLGLSLAAIGMLASLNTIVALVLKPLMGAAADRYGRKRTLVAAMAARSVLALLYGLATTPLALYGVRAGHGLADSMRDPSVTALIADNGGKQAVASAFAWYQTAKTVAGSIGKSVAGLLLAASAGSYATVFAVAFALSALPLLVVAVFVRQGDTTVAAEVEPPARPPDQPPSGPRTRSYVVLGFLVSGAASMLGTLFPILATEYAGLSPAQAGALYLVTPALALSGPLFGWLADHVSSRLVLSLRSLANVGSSLLYLLVPSVPGFLTGRALDDLGKAAFKPAWGSIMAEVSSADLGRRARTMSWMSTGEDAGDIAAPVVAGLLWTAWGAPAVLLARMVLAIAAEAWALWLTRTGRPGAAGRMGGPRLSR